METQRIEEPFDFSKVTCVVIPKSLHEIEFEERVREQLAQNYTREQIYENITTRQDLSHLGSPSYENSKKLNNLVSQASSLKFHLETHMDHKNQDSKILFSNIKKVIRLVTSYQRDTSDLPFDWVRKCFFPSNFRGWKYSYPEVESWISLFGMEPLMQYDPLDKDDCKTVDGSKTAEGSLKDPLCISNLAVPGLSVVHNLGKAWLYVGYFLDENEKNLPNAEEVKIWLEFKEFDKGTHESEVTNPKFDDGEIKSVGVDHSVVSAVGNSALAAFIKACKKRESEVTNRKFDDGEIKSVGVDHPIVSAVGNSAVAAFSKACKKRESEVTNLKFDGEIKSVRVDHPIVSAVGNFAVAAFNKACKKHVKRGEDNNLHGFEFMECKYLKLGKLKGLPACEIYQFYIIIEAIEEGTPGTYMAEVSCNSTNGAKLLCKFFLTDYRPSGMKAMAVSYFYFLESICKTVDDLYKEKLARLKELYKHTNVCERPIAAGERGRLRKLHAKLQEDLLVRCASARLRCPPDFDRMTNPDGWCDQVDDHRGSGMVRRAKGTSCSGYDYYNPYVDGRDESSTRSKGS